MKTIVIGIALIGISEILCAADTATHSCASVRDDAERLACYDQAFGKPAVPAAAAPKKQFGFTQQEVARKNGQPSESEGPASVSAAIKALHRLHDGKFVVTLDNSQVWAQSEFNSQADVAIGDTITVRRGALGSYLLVTKAGIGTRVRRVK
jgi:hypothetical protein